MAYSPLNPNGQASMANSQPVVVASDQSAVPVSAASLPLPTGAATSTKQSDGSQKTQVVDGSGNVIGATSNALDINIKSGNPTSITANAGADLNTSALALESGGNLATIASAIKAEDAASADADKGIQVLAVRKGTPANTSGTDGDYEPLQVSGGRLWVDASGKTLTVDASGVAVPVTDNSSSLTVDAPVGTPVFVRLSDGASAITTLPVSLASVPSHAVTNAGTFAVQVDGSALTALQLIDDTVFTDDTSTHSTGSTKGQGIMAVANPTDAAVDANDIGMVAMTLARALKNDITTIAGTAPTTAGFIDVKGADGNVFVRQATASNLNMTEASAASILTSVQLIDDVVYTDDTSTHSTGTSKGALIMAAATPTDTAVNANDIGAIGMTNNREMYVSLRDISGAAAVTGSGNATGALRVELANNGTGTLSTVSTVSALGVGTTGPQKAEDVASAGGDMGVLMMASRLDTPVANAAVSNDGDYTNPILDNFRKLWVTGTVPEDTGHVAGEALTVLGARRIDPIANSAGSDADWATVNQSAEGALYSTLSPTTASGCSVFMATSADGSTALTSTAQAIKASAGNLYGYYIYNPNASATYVHLYNTAAASVTVGTTNPLITFCIPATSAANVTFPYPVTFSNAGWSCSATTTGPGNTAPSSALEAVFYFK